MKCLFDHNVDRRLRRHLPGHEIRTTKEKGWQKLGNGVLLQAAADAGFDVFLSIDKKLEYEQNLKKLPMTVIVIDSISNALPELLPFVVPLLELLKSPLERGLYLIQSDAAII